MAPQLDVDDVRASEYRDSAGEEGGGGGGGGFPSLTPQRSGVVAAARRVQQQLHKASGILFIMSIVMGVVAIVTLLVRQALEFFSYDDKDQGWGSRGYGYRDFPIVLIALTSIVFASLNRTRLRVHNKPLPPVINATVLTLLLVVNCAVGFGMVPWRNAGDTACVEKLPKLSPDTPHYEFYVTWCKRILLYSRVRTLDMVAVDTHALITLGLFVLSLGLFYCDKRISGEGLLTAEVLVAKQWGARLAESGAQAKEWLSSKLPEYWTQARQWSSRSSQGWTPIPSSASNEI